MEGFPTTDASASVAMDDGPAMPDLASQAPAPVPTGPDCPYCNRPARLATGRETVPHRAGAEEMRFWSCTPCKAYVACHEGTTAAMGTPAKHLLRRARRELHDDVLDPIWRSALETGGYRDYQLRTHIAPAVVRKARERVYGWLAERLGLGHRETHVGLFDLETCRRAEEILKGVDYPKIQAWGRNKDRADKARRRASERAVVVDLVKGGISAWAWGDWCQGARSGARSD